MTHTSHRRTRTPGRRRSVAVASAISVLATAAAVTAGTVVTTEPVTVDAAVSAPAEAPAALGLTAADFAEREQRISRSIERQERQERQEQRERERRQAEREAERQAERERRAAERAEAAEAAEAERQEQLRSADPRQIAQSLMPEYGLSAGEFSCLDQLWQKESEWDATAANPTSSAYGIPQALPGSKMSSAGADWETNPATQIRWGLGYIRDRYGSACSAWSHSQANNWY